MHHTRSIIRLGAAVAVVAAATCPNTTPPVWPDRFVLVQRRIPDDQSSGNATTVTYYDWPNQANLIVITEDRNESNVLWDLELGTGRSYYYYPLSRECTPMKFPVGILRRDWLPPPPPPRGCPRRSPPAIYGRREPRLRLGRHRRPTPQGAARRASRRLALLTNQPRGTRGPARSASLFVRGSYRLKMVSSEVFSMSAMGLRTFDLFVSTMQPFMTISSRMKCAFSRLNMMSSSQTDSKYLSSVSTRAWMNSRMPSSFSLSCSTPTMKKRDAYRR
mmetsp:Transcript_1643/g.4999  ORF Transcript_1643/g.4999 Transcript_1643/m.4999 type:complete len:275 (-) Transcript_1643:214-1038(-)